MGRKAGIKLSEKEKNELQSARKSTKDAKSFRAMTGVLLRGSPRRTFSTDCCKESWSKSKTGFYVVQSLQEEKS